MKQKSNILHDFISPARIFKQYILDGTTFTFWLTAEKQLYKKTGAVNEQGFVEYLNNKYVKSNNGAAAWANTKNDAEMKAIQDSTFGVEGNESGSDATTKDVPPGDPDKSIVKKRVLGMKAPLAYGLMIVGGIAVASAIYVIFKPKKNN